MNAVIVAVIAGMFALQTSAACMEPSGVSARAPASPLTAVRYSAPRADSAELSNAALGGALTSYLKHHRLPLVGASVATEPDGARNIILYGFTATEFGKIDAVRKSRRFLGNQPIGITNRIIVRPELAHAPAKHRVPALDTASPPPSSTPPSSAASSNDIRAYMAQGQPYRVNESGTQNPDDMWSTVGPLLGIAALVAGAVAVGGLVGHGGYGYYPPPRRPYR